MKRNKKTSATSFQPGIVSLLIAIISGITLLLLAYFGVIFSA